MVSVRRYAGIAAAIAMLAACMPPLHSLAAEGEPVLERCLISLVEEAQVPAREAGVLVELQIREGDVVSRGDLIARIDELDMQRTGTFWHQNGEALPW